MAAKVQLCKCGKHQLVRAKGRGQWRRQTEYIGSGHSVNHSALACFEIKREPLEQHLKEQRGKFQFEYYHSPSQIFKRLA